MRILSINFSPILLSFEGFCFLFLVLVVETWNINKRVAMTILDFFYFFCFDWLFILECNLRLESFFFWWWRFPNFGANKSPILCMNFRLDISQWKTEVSLESCTELQLDVYKNVYLDCFLWWKLSKYFNHYIDETCNKINVILIIFSGPVVKWI